MKGHATVGSIGLLVVVGLAALSAQEKPNFTGRWVLVTPAESAGQERSLSKASWNGNQLTIDSDTTYPDGRRRRTTAVWSLDDEGRLVIDFTESGPISASPKTTKLVYARG
jgi:hypothetical protein